MANNFVFLKGPIFTAKSSCSLVLNNPLSNMFFSITSFQLLLVCLSLSHKLHMFLLLLELYFHMPITIFVFLRTLLSGLPITSQIDLLLMHLFIINHMLHCHFSCLQFFIFLRSPALTIMTYMTFLAQILHMFSLIIWLKLIVEI